MRKEIIASGKDIQSAVANAKEALGVGAEDHIEYEVVELGSKGIFGIIGVKPAKVKAYIELPDRGNERHHARSDRPARGEGEGEKRAQGNNRNGKKKNNRPRHSRPEIDINSKQFRDSIKESRPSSVVIPEAELTFEKIEANEGDDRSLDFIRALIADLGMNAAAELFTCSDGTRRIVITGEDASVLIGHHGDTLDSLQYLANLASAKKKADGTKDRTRVTLDIEGYRAKREDTLRALARKKAAQALRNNRSVMLEPMTPYERRIIHSEVQGIEGVATNSIGSDNNRKIVIYLTDKKPKAAEVEADTETDVEADA